MPRARPGTRSRHRRRSWVHRLFLIGLAFKGIDGALEIIGGALLVIVSPEQLNALVRNVTQNELNTDPHDIVANFFRHATRHLDSGTETFAALYLLSHGVVKAGLVAVLLLGRRWAYPVAIAAFTLFVGYQLYRYTLTHSAMLLVLSALDIVVIVLTILEARRVRRAGIV